jgi:hypothetical protein
MAREMKLLVSWKNVLEDVPALSTKEMDMMHFLQP